jgi:hypothetical protein
MAKTKFGKVQVTDITRKDGKTIFAATPAANIPAAAAITAATTDATAAKLTDVQSMRTTLNSLLAAAKNAGFVAPDA